MHEMLVAAHASSQSRREQGRHFFHLGQRMGQARRFVHFLHQGGTKQTVKIINSLIGKFQVGTLEPKLDRLRLNVEDDSVQIDTQKLTNRLAQGTRATLQVEKRCLNRNNTL